MSVKQERPETIYPPPPPLLQHGMRPRQPVYAPPAPAGMYNYRVPTPRAPTLQPSPATGLQGSHEIPSTSSPVVPPETVMSEEDLNSRIDKASIKGTFGWETIDSANIPCIFRDGDKYVSVRMVEQKLLSKYPSTYPDELRNRPPLMSQFITQPEARLLNEINIEHCACEYGQRSFTDKDLVVRLKDFVEFYQIVKKHFPNELRLKEKTRQAPATESSGGGWVQVNNTVVPYIRRPTPSAKEVLNLAPLPVIKYAAGLLTDTEVPSLEPTDEECKLLSDMCKSAGLDFNFSHNTPLILLQQLPVYCSTKVVIKRLPDDDPFGNAEYCPEFDMEDAKVAPLPAGGVMLPTMQDLSPQTMQTYQTRLPQGPGYVTGPPNVTVQPGSNIPFQKQDGGHPSQALTNIAGPPKKKPRTSASPSEPDARRVSNGNQSSSPVQNVQNGIPANLYPGGIVRHMAPLPGMPGYRPGLQPFPVRPGSNLVMTHPNMMPAAPAMWPPAPTNSSEMQKLAQMMNMQAAILSGNTQPPTLIQQKADIVSPKAVNNQVSPTATSTITGQTNAAASTSSQVPNVTKAAKTTSRSRRDPNLEKIQPVDFHGKKISCLVKGENNERYALIEAISRVYYPHCSLEEFIKVMTNVLQIPIYQLDREEEKAFISFYGLPTSSLKCNKVLNLANLDKLMPQLKYMFKGKDEGKSGASSKNDPISTPSPKPVQVQGPNPPQDTNNNAGPVVSQPSSLPPPNPFPATNKKPQGSGLSGLSKLSKLEDAVNRLRQNKLMELEGKDPSSVQEPSVPNKLCQGQVPRNPFAPQK